MRNQYPSAFVSFITAVIVSGAVSVSAQETDPADAARFRIGPLRFTPSIALTNLGVDTNVFNEGVDPKQDQTGAVGPSIDLWMHLGRSRLLGKTSGQYLYFKQNKNQRAWNTIDEGRWEVPMARITPWVAGTYANTKSRPGYEIDSRARQSDQSVSLGTDVDLSGKTRVTLSGKRSLVTYDDNQIFDGADLASALNARTNSEQLQLRYKLTPLTTVVVNGEALQDRFIFEPFRDANSIRILPGFEMKPSALISGRVLVGYRRFVPLDPSVPPSDGLAASVDAKYSAHATQFDVKVGRDIAFSYQTTQPYYTLTDAGVGVTQRITYTWDVVVRASRQTLDYTRVLTVNPDEPGQIDRIRQYGGGIGYRIGDALRLGVDGIYYRRRSSNPAFRDYEGARFGASVTYRVPQ